MPSSKRCRPAVWGRTSHSHCAKYSTILNTTDVSVILPCSNDNDSTKNSNRAKINSRISYAKIAQTCCYHQYVAGMADGSADTSPAMYTECIAIATLRTR